MRLSAFDIASRVTGWCAGDTASTPETGVFELPQVKDDLGRLGLHFWKCLHLHVLQFQPEVILFEAPILVVKKRGRAGYTDKLSTLRKLYGLSFFLETFCARREIRCHEVDLHAIKREVTGNAFAPKDDMVAVARKVGLALPEGKYEGRTLAEDAADAWGAWLVGVRTYDRPASAMWDRKIWTPRGAML